MKSKKMSKSIGNEALSKEKTGTLEVKSDFSKAMDEQQTTSPTLHGLTEQQFHNRRASGADIQLKQSSQLHLHCEMLPEHMSQHESGNRLNSRTTVRTSVVEVESMAEFF